jgi:hypothetical protein
MARLYEESTAYKVLQETGWKLQMAASGKWMQNMAGSRKIRKSHQISDLAQISP